MPFRQLSDEQLATAEKMLADGASVAETSKATGVSAPTLYKKFRNSKDPTPGGRRSTKAKKPGPTDEQLTSLFAKVGSAPAIPAGLLLHCDYCAAHFANTGPVAAKQLVDLSSDHPALRSVMEGLWRYADEVAWAGVLVTWLGVPVAHHLAPDFIYKYLQFVTTLPPRGNEPAMNGHAHQGAPPPPADGDVTMPTPFAGMDMESLLSMAKQFGINVEMPPMNGDNADTAAEPATSEQAAADDTAPAEDATAAPDSDTSE